MKNLNTLNKARVYNPEFFLHYGNYGDETCGVFEVPTVDGRLRVIASSGEEWDHVSVSLPNRCPDWQEMEGVKRLFFKDDETAMQLHVPPADHINHHPFCLHLWRPHGVEIPRPPAWMIGPSPDDVRKS
jgi:hypothetical protein